jgi:uncharacterized protein YaiE (UPF0345 family)
VRHIASESPWLPWRFSGFVSRNTGIDKATNGLASAETVRGEQFAVMSQTNHEFSLMLLFVLKGSISLEVDSKESPIIFMVGSSITIPSDCSFQLKIRENDSEFFLVQVT